MQNLYNQLSESFKVQWPDSQITCGIHQGSQRPFHKFLIQDSPLREIRIELTPEDLRVSCIFQNPFYGDQIGGSHIATIENNSKSEFILYSILGESLKTNCYSCLEPVVIDQMKKALILSDTQ